jgi:hypothetical protein
VGVPTQFGFLSCVTPTEKEKKAAAVTRLSVCVHFRPKIILRQISSLGTNKEKTQKN